MVTTTLDDKTVSDVFNRGDVYTEDSGAEYYYKSMTEPPIENRSFSPFVIYGGSAEYIAIIDVAENRVFTLYLHEPNYIADEDGTLVRIVDNNQEYDFFYEEVDEGK